MTPNPESHCPHGILWSDECGRCHADAIASYTPASVPDAQDIRHSAQPRCPHDNVVGRCGICASTSIIPALKAFAEKKARLLPPPKNTEPTSDPVNHPDHYKQGGIECIKAIEAALGDGFAAYCRGNALKYIWRSEHKGNPIQDLKKAIVYLDFAIENMKGPDYA